MKPILSVNELAARLGVRVAALRNLADTVDAHYRHKPKEIRKDVFRHLSIPQLELKEVQKRLRLRVLNAYLPSASAHGAVRGRSPRTNAAMHQGKKCVITIDVEKFYPSVRHYVVCEMLCRDLGFGREVAHLITRLTTHDAGLPQGAPTSSGIANLLLRASLDGPMEQEADELGAVYTRYIDDTGLSGDDPRPLIHRVATLLSRSRLKIHRRKPNTETKFRIMTANERQNVTGLNVVRRHRNLKLRRHPESRTPG